MEFWASIHARIVGSPVVSSCSGLASCACRGCNQSVKVLDPWPMINLPTTYPQPFGNWSGDQSQLVNGGVPQAGNLARMLQTLETGIDSWIPDRQWCASPTVQQGPLLFTAVRGGQGRARRDRL